MVMGDGRANIPRKEKKLVKCMSETCIQWVMGDGRSNIPRKKYESVEQTSETCI